MTYQFSWNIEVYLSRNEKYIFILDLLTSILKEKKLKFYFAVHVLTKEL